MGPEHRHGGRDRHFGPHGAEHGGRGHRGRRPFDYGALRLVVLEMIADQPRHGYELMKAIEERMGGGYSPSPGVIYPTLSWLEDMGYAAAEADGGRRSFRVTAEGEAFLAANRDALAEIGTRIGRPGDRRHAPEPILRAMETLKRALRARFVQGPVDPAGVELIEAAIRAAARQVDTTMTDATTEIQSSTATVTTPKAAGYLAQLCKHFAHKIPASFEGGRGEISFPAGACRLLAEGDRLTMTVEATDAEALARLQDVVARHLLRFAFREQLAVDWRPA